MQAGELAVHLSDPKTEPPVSVAINLIYEDDQLIVLDKPSPIPVHASGRFVRNTLINILELAFPTTTFKLLHRIDANTTGVIVLAKNKIAANFVQQQFENKTIKKTYIALVEGLVVDDYMNLQQLIGTELGHPIVGDIGHKDPTYFENNPFTYETDSLFLHAHKLVITHPTTKKEIAFAAPIPVKFNT